MGDELFYIYHREKGKERKGRKCSCRQTFYCTCCYCVSLKSLLSTQKAKKNKLFKCTYKFGARWLRRHLKAALSYLISELKMSPQRAQYDIHTAFRFISMEHIDWYDSPDTFSFPAPPLPIFNSLLSLFFLPPALPFSSAPLLPVRKMYEFELLIQTHATCCLESLFVQVSVMLHAMKQIPQGLSDTIRT